MSKNHPIREVPRESGVVGDSNCVSQIDGKSFDDDLLMQPKAQDQVRNIENKSLKENSSKVLPSTELNDKATVKTREGHDGPVTTRVDERNHLEWKRVDYQDGRHLTINYEKGMPVKLTRPDGYAFVKNEKGTWDFKSPDIKDIDGKILEPGEVLWNARKFSVKLHDGRDGIHEKGSVTYKVNNTSEKKIDAEGKYHDLGKVAAKKETISNKPEDNPKSDNKKSADITQNSEIPGGNVVALSIHPEQWVSGKDESYKGKNLSSKPVEVPASYYADKFHGRKTSNGETFNMNKMTCAYIGLPFGTELEVTNPKNGKSCIVRVNDHGPYHGNRVIDLSKAAMAKLDGIGPGVINVTARIINRLKHKPEKAQETAYLPTHNTLTLKPEDKR